MATYSTADSRLASFLIIRGCPLQETETRFSGDEDRVHLIFTVAEDQIAALKREFFEGGQVPALEFANQMKFVMHTIREARELSRNSR